MSAEASKNLIEIESKPPQGAKPGYVSLLIDGDRRFTVRTSDLENIGAQLRGKKAFSAFQSIGLPIIVSVLTVIVTTLVGQFFQYVSWRNSTLLTQATERASNARQAFERASRAMSERYYVTFLYLDAARDLANRKTDIEAPLYKLDMDANRKRMDAFQDQMKLWNIGYDQLLSDIDFSLDRPVLKKPVRVSMRDFRNKFRCDAMLLDELNRLQLNVHSLKVQFAAVHYCFMQSLQSFNVEKEKAVLDKTHLISEKEKANAGTANEDVRSMANEFRCYAQHRIAYLEERKKRSIFKLSRWVGEHLAGSRETSKALAEQANMAALTDCDFSKPLPQTARISATR